MQGFKFYQDKVFIDWNLYKFTNLNLS